MILSKLYVHVLLIRAFLGSLFLDSFALKNACIYVNELPVMAALPKHYAPREEIEYEVVPQLATHDTQGRIKDDRKIPAIIIFQAVFY